MNTTEQCFDDMRDSTLEYVNKWLPVAEAMGRAYSEAVRHQQAVTDAIKKSIEEARKKEMEMMTFALGLVTGGLVGAVAGRLIPKVSALAKDSSLNALTTKAAEDSLLTEWTRDTLKELAKAGEEKLRKAGLKLVIPDASKDEKLTPQGLAPDVYASYLRSGIYVRANLLSDFARACYRELQWLPLQIAQQMRSVFLASSFFTSVPGSIDEERLRRRAEVAVWVAWARLRDRNFWDIQNALAQVGQASESYDWASLLDELAKLGVPVRPLTLESYVRTGLVGPIRKKRTINMPAFIDWAKGEPAMDLIFHGLPTDKHGVKAARARMATKSL